jgi:hypothetical protein
MGLSLDQYRYFSAAWVREFSRRVKGEGDIEAKAAPTPRPATTVRPTSITWLVPRSRVLRSNEPD